MPMTIDRFVEYCESPEYKEKLRRDTERAREAERKYWDEFDNTIGQHPIGVPHCSARGGIINFD